MNSLVGYGSDDNSDESGDNRFPEMPGHPNQTPAKNYRKPASHEDNYEEVGMDMSEDSNSSGGPANQAPQNQDNRSGSRSPKYKQDEDDKRNGRGEDRNRDDRIRDDRHSRRRDDERDRRRNDERDRRRDDEKDKRRVDDKDKVDRSRKDDDKGRDKNRDDRRDRRDDRYGRNRRDRRHSKSRERRRSSRSPKRSSPRRNSRSPRGSPRRSRSGSKDKEYKNRGFTTRREKADKRMDRLGKLGIEFKPDNYPASAIEEAERNSKDDGNKFFMPGITGRFREQIEKRKLLWQKAKEPDTKPAVPVATCSTSSVSGASGSKATKVYEATTFADDRTSNKFKRLMGIRETDASTLPVKSTDVLKKQQEMFTSMEAQYEVARTATHTMRGVGLGFGSFQR